MLETIALRAFSTKLFLNKQHLNSISILISLHFTSFAVKTEHHHHRHERSIVFHCRPLNYPPGVFISTFLLFFFTGNESISVSFRMPSDMYVKGNKEHFYICLFVCFLFLLFSHFSLFLHLHHLIFLCLPHHWIQNWILLLFSASAFVVIENGMTNSQIA